MTINYLTAPTDIFVTDKIVVLDTLRKRLKIRVFYFTFSIEMPPRAWSKLTSECFQQLKAASKNSLKISKIIPNQFKTLMQR